MALRIADALYITSDASHTIVLCLCIRAFVHVCSPNTKGALYIEDFIRLCQAIGFTDPRILHKSAELVSNAELEAKLGEAKFYSITYRLFKMPEEMLETKCEDYGQVAMYKGTIPGRCARLLARSIQM